MIDSVHRDHGEIILCAVQAGSFMFDLPKTLDHFAQLLIDARKQIDEKYGPRFPVVVVFPEAFLGGYPRGLGFGAVVGSRTEEGRALFQRYHCSAVPVCDTQGPIMSKISEAVAAARVTCVVGVIERCDHPETGMHRTEYGSAAPGGPGTLYCSALTFGSDGKLLACHRKLQPTGSERLVWGQGDGAGIRVSDTPAGRVGACICWENYMPAYRMALYADNVEIYAAPTADCRPTWTCSMQHIACEGRTFVVSCCQMNTLADFPKDYPAYEGLKTEEVVTRGGSLICDPLGNILAGPLYDQTGILTAKVNRSRLAEARMDFDPTGHYARPDVFHLSVDRSSKSAVS